MFLGSPGMSTSVLMPHGQRMGHLYGQLDVVRVDRVVRAVGQHSDLLFDGRWPGELLPAVITQQS